jgi:hypothetical protein
MPGFFFGNIKLSTLNLSLKPLFSIKKKGLRRFEGLFYGLFILLLDSCLGPPRFIEIHNSRCDNRNPLHFVLQIGS